jgi:hypothetical protein
MYIWQFIKSFARNCRETSFQQCSGEPTEYRQSAKLFLQSSELGLPQPLTRRRVCPPPPRFWGEGHTRWRERGWESPNSDEGTYTVVLCIYVLCEWASRIPVGQSLTIFQSVTLSRPQHWNCQRKTFLLKTIFKRMIEQYRDCSYT